MLWPVARSLQLAAAIALAALPALVGHAGATPGTAGEVHLVSDMVHLLASSAWLGGLPAFVLLLWQARRTAEPAWYDFTIRATRRFSVVGILSVGALLASGLINSWNLLSGPRDLVISDYGRLVALKIGLFAAMVGIAAVNRFYLTPRLPDLSVQRALQRNSLAEVGLGLCVLLCVGVLGTLPPAAHKHATPEGIPPDAAFVHIHAPEAMADVIVDPVGSDGRRFRYASCAKTSPVSQQRTCALLSNRRLRLNQTLEQNAIEQADGSWLVKDIPLGEPGIWTVRVIVTPKGGEPIPLDAPHNSRALMSAFGPKRTCRSHLRMSASEVKRTCSIAQADAAFFG